MALALSAMAVLISFQTEGDVNVAPAFRFETDATGFANGHFPSKDERLYVWAVHVCENVDTVGLMVSADWTGHARRPPPIVCDLDDDGQNEILIATRDQRLVLLEYRPESDAAVAMHPDHANVVEKAQASLSGSVRLAQRRQAAAVATGFVDPTLPSDPSAAATPEPRRQRVAVLTKAMDVLCFNHDLNLLWERSLEVDIQRDVYVMEASAVVVPASATHPHGLVIVGGRLGRTESSVEHRSEWADPGTGADEEDSSARTTTTEPNAVVEGHFSYYALDAYTGDIVWKHEEGDFLNTRQGPREQIEYLTDHFKTDARLPMRHRGEQDWRQYRAALIRSALPHRWWDSSDTHLRLAHFEKNRRAGGQSATRQHNIEGAASRRRSNNQDQTTMGVARTIGLENLGELSGGLLFPSASDDTGGPATIARRGIVGAASENGQGTVQADAYNVLVAHLHDGIEVLQLYSGQPLCRVPLGGDAHGEASMHADVNGDGVLDHVAAIVGQGQEAVPRVSQCHALARSGIPPIEPLFNGSLCDDGGSLDQFLDQAAHYMDGKGGAFVGERADAASVEAVPPIAVPRLDGARTAADLASAVTFDSVFLVSDGKVTSYSPTGKLNWHISTAALWPTLAERQSQRARLGLNGGDGDEVDGNEAAVFAMDLSARPAFRASLSLLPMQASGPVLGGRYIHILAVGWTQLVLLTAHGDVVTTLPLRSAPLSPPTLGDFNNDGITDIILTRRNGIDGYRTEHHSGGMLFAGLIYILLAVVILLILREVFFPLVMAEPLRARARATD